MKKNKTSSADTISLSIKKFIDDVRKANLSIEEKKKLCTDAGTEIKKLYMEQK